MAKARQRVRPGGTLIIGLGNPIVRDDGVGIHAARELAGRLAGRSDAVVEEAAVGGMALMEMMLDRDRVIIVDAIQTGKAPPGTITRMTPDDFRDTHHASNPHDMSFLDAIQFARRMFPERLPEMVIIYAVEAQDISNFGEELTPNVARAVPAVVEKVLRDISA